jgi:hypothetical protein
MNKSNPRDVLLGWALAILLDVLLLAHPAGLAKAITGGATDGVVTLEQEQAPSSNLLLAKRSVPGTHNSGLVGDISSGSGASGDKPVQPRNQPPRQPSNPKHTNYNEVLPNFMRTPQFLNK